MHNRDPVVRAAAIESIRTTASRDMAEKARTKLDDPAPTVRIAAIECLWKNGIRNTKLIGKFIAMFEDESADVSRKALTALKGIKSRQAGRLGDDRKAWKDWWARYKEQMGLIDKVEGNLKILLELRAQQTAESMRKAKDLYHDSIKALTDLRRHKDLIWELKQKSTMESMKMQDVKRKFEKQKYAILKGGIIEAGKY